jgi:hypothetical protein
MIRVHAQRAASLSAFDPLAGAAISAVAAGYVEVGGFAWLTRAGAAMSAGRAKAGDNARCGEGRK